jgi:hypothetical protein
MAKEIVGVVDVNMVKKGLVKYPGFFLCADLYVKTLDFIWEENEKKATLTIGNKGLKDSGSFMVYFNLEEEPISQNHRPQERLWVVNLPAGGEVVQHVDFTHLAHPDNHNLENVYKLIVEIDPKDMVHECNETNNTATQDIAKQLEKHPKEIIEKSPLYEKPYKEFEKNPKEFIEKSPLHEKPHKEFEKNPKEQKEFEKSPKEQVENIHDINREELINPKELKEIAERLNILEEKLGQAFISKDERPDVGKDILKKKK